MDCNHKNIMDYTSFVCRICKEENLKHLDSTALAKLVEYGARMAEDQEKLSTKFNEVSDVLREASYYAGVSGSGHVTADHVRHAIEEKHYRSSLLQEKIAEMIGRNLLMIDITGQKVGQVNGLSVMDLGDIRFGRPNKITATIGLGREGLIDIEREAKLGGPIHTKGVMILSGFLSGKYARETPLSLSARLVFEQSYSGVDGDSASSAELYAILSSLSNQPVKQGIAITGSINQWGEVQAVGGVNEKIEGFFETCKMKGLTGEQGVIIPQANVKNLMLKEEIIEAVTEDRFKVWSVKTVDEGIEILTGLRAGVQGEDGRFEEGTVHDLVDKRLKQQSETLKSFSHGEKPQASQS